MKTNSYALGAAAIALALFTGLAGCRTSPSAKQATPKRLLVVTTTAGFRHTSIPTLEKVLTQLGKDSGEFTVDFVQQPPGEPAQRRGATPEEQQAYAEARMKFREALTNALLKLAPANLKNYDGVVFASTTGDLPISDPQGLLDWIKAGHAFIGIHAASDTFHNWPGYIEMLGGEFDHHGPQLSVDCLNQDPQHPATAPLPKVWTITQEEMYQFKKYSPTNVHDLLILDQRPQVPRTAGHYPVSWCRNYGAGKVFYTSLGHREDIIDADPNLPDRRNSPEISRAYDAHVLGGIEWALKLKK